LPAEENLKPTKTDLYESRSLTTLDAIQSLPTAAMLSRQVFRSLRAAAPQRAIALRAAPVRTFAAAASSDVKAPIAVFGLDGTYATALVRLLRIKTKNPSDISNVKAANCVLFFERHCCGR
jgi:hypothetical protein